MRVGRRGPMKRGPDSEDPLDAPARGDVEPPRFDSPTARTRKASRLGVFEGVRQTSCVEDPRPTGLSRYRVPANPSSMGGSIRPKSGLTLDGVERDWARSVQRVGLDLTTSILVRKLVTWWCMAPLAKSSRGPPGTDATAERTRGYGHGMAFVSSGAPGKNPEHTFRQTLSMGYSSLPPSQIKGCHCDGPTPLGSTEDAGAIRKGVFPARGSHGSMFRGGVCIGDPMTKQRGLRNDPTRGRTARRRLAAVGRRAHAAPHALQSRMEIPAEPVEAAPTFLDVPRLLCTDLGG